MIKTINIILIFVNIILGFMLYKSFNDPIKIQKEIVNREDVVHAKLLKIRDSQEAFKRIHGKFAPDFDTLIDVMKTGKFTSVSLRSGDTTSVNLKDTLFGGDIDAINQLSIVPYSEDKKFELDAGVLPSPTDSTLYLPVFEAATYTDIFLSDVNPNFWKPGSKVKVGSMTAPITSGNWE